MKRDVKMKVILAPDKFKGSLTSMDVCNAVREGLQLADGHIAVHAFPMADGGDGFAAVMQQYTQTETVACTTVDPLHRPIQASYQWNPVNKIAVIELAAASGLVLLQPEERNPLQTTTYGTGLLIKDAIGKGVKKIILGIGGSATNDAGTGILAALGFTFMDAGDKAIPPSGENLLLIRKIIPPAVLPAVRFEIACDVDNVLYGPQGAAFIYAPQKGASKEQVELLDEGLKHFAAVTSQQTNVYTANHKGMGAAGGIAAGIVPFFDAVLKQGTQIVIEASNIENALPGADLIITGEGKLDGQSKNGKLISHITVMANRHHIPAIALCGSLQLNATEIKELGLNGAFSIMNERMGLQYSIKNAAELLRKEATRVITAFLDDRKRK
jgi:glycerate 2-kinase